MTNPIRRLRLLPSLLALLAAAAPVRAADQVIADFDGKSPEGFAFKDEKGTTLNASGAYRDKEKGVHLGLRYRVVAGGWAGWGVGLTGVSAAGHRYFSFALKGARGGEFFEIGLRDKGGQERKLPIRQFTDPSTQWQQVLIPLSEFKGVTLSALDNLTFSFNEESGAGQIYVDDIRFEGTLASADLAQGPTYVNKSLVDGFERTNPSDAYQVFQGDESSLTLASSRVVYDGDYAMEFQYRFSTSRPWGSWVSAMRHFRDPLDWSGAQEVKLWVKGDGSDNALRFRVVEADGETWDYVDDRILKALRWTLVTMPVRRFRRVVPTTTNRNFDLDRIRSYQIDILSPDSNLSGGAKLGQGRIQVDQLYLAGERMRAAQSAPPGTVQQLRLAVPTVGNVDFTLFALTEYLYAPETKNRVSHYAKLVANAKAGNISARAEFASKPQEFGEASTFVGLSTVVVTNQFPLNETPSFQVMVNNISPYLTNVTLGNVFVDYGPYAFVADFGFKGVTLEGDYDRLNYHAFAIKHVFNSFTGGGRLRAGWRNFRLTGQSVVSEETAKVNNGSAVLDVRRVSRDAVYNVEAEARAFDDRLLVRGTYGYDDFRKMADVDRTNPFDPLFVAYLTTGTRVKTGDMWRARVELDRFPWRGLNVAYTYRDVDTDFKPRFRQIPVFFDDTEADQWGHNVRVTQYARGWVISNEYDTLQRRSGSAFYRHRYNWGLGYYGYRGMDLAFNQEYRREEYTFGGDFDRSSFTAAKNEKVIGSELYVRAQLSPRLAYWVRPRQERIWHPLTNRTFTTDILLMKLEFYVNSNARFFAEHKTSRYGDGSEPVGYPYDDNFTKVTFEVTF